MAKVIFEFDDKRIANILVITMENDSNLLQTINSTIDDYNEEEGKENPIENFEYWNVVTDDSEHNPEHTITIE